MKRILFALLLVVGFAYPFSGQTIASRRYAEKTPEQYVFGPLNAIAPFNGNPNHAIGSNTQLQPPSLITDNNQFSSTSNFTITTQQTPAATFSVSGNIGTVVTGSGSAQSWRAASTGASCQTPTCFVSMEINQNGTTSFLGRLTLGLILSNGNVVQVVYRVDTGVGEVQTIVGGTSTNVGSFSKTLPTAPWYLALSFVGNDFTVWETSNLATGWSVLETAAIATMNMGTSGLMTGARTLFGVDSSGTTTWEFSNLIAGAFGGVGLSDISLVTYSDGRPYIQGTKAYFTATSRSPLDASFQGSYDGVYSYDLSAGTWTQLGAIFDLRGGIVENDSASHLVYDPALNEYRYMVGAWATTIPPPTFYGAWATSTFDPINVGGVGIVTLTQMNYANPGYDSHFACSSWNYSAGTCSKWIVTYAGNALSGGAFSASDPSANSWTSIGSVSATSTIEGNRVFRTAAGSKGINYEFGIGGYSSSGVASETKFFDTYSQVSYSAVGSLTAQIPSGISNTPHPQIFSYGNTEYLITFDNTLFGTAVDTMGNLLIATSPKYTAQKNYPQFAAGTDTAVSAAAASITSSAVTVTSGDLAVVYCTGNDNSVVTTSVAVSSSLSLGTYVGAGFEHSGSDYDEAYYLMGASTGGSSTFTCTPNASKTFQSITVLIFHPGFVTTTDTITTNGYTGTEVPFVSKSFSTTAQGLIVVCAVPEFVSTNIVPGFIGPYKSASAFGLVGTFQGACQSTVTDAAQTSITANMGVTSIATGIWGGAILSFK